MNQPCYIALGRLGDLAGCALPLAYADSLKGLRPQIIVSEEFASLMDGVGYADCIVFPKPYDRLADAIRMYPQATVAQVFANARYWPALMQGDTSYQRIQWRAAGREADIGLRELVFDRRDKEREIRTLGFRSWSNTILVSTKGHSSPFAVDLVTPLKERLPNHDVFDIGDIRAQRPYDLLYLMDRAKCLVATDSFPLHLAAASKIPVVAILNDGWRGSLPPRNTVAQFRYSSVTPSAVCDAVERLLRPVGRTLLVVDDFGESPRHNAARASWSSQFDVVIRGTEWKRNATQIGNKRSLPFMRDLLEVALEASQSGDVVCTTNSDCVVGDLSTIIQHAHKFGAVSVRRDERNNENHIGREFYAFSADFLRDHLHEFPDVILGMPWVDLCVARFIRNHYGIKTTGAPETPWDQSNLWRDIWPSELPKGAIFHEVHSSSWTGADEAKTAAYAWNSRKWNEGWKDSI